MLDLLTPVRVESLKEACVEQLEALIVSGHLSVGQKLPSQRLLANQMGVSRAVVHEALIFLSGKGLVKMIPRVGTVVSDYRVEGSMAMLTSLFKYQRPELSPPLFDGLLAMRTLVEIETARLAALYSTQEQVAALKELISKEEAHEPEDVQGRAILDFEFHHLIAMAGGNDIYPLLINAFKPIYTTLVAQFYRDPDVAATVIAFHRDLLDAVKKQDDHLAVAAMRCLLAHGEEHLRIMLTQDTEYTRDTQSRFSNCSSGH